MSQFEVEAAFRRQVAIPQTRDRRYGFKLRHCLGSKHWAPGACQGTFANRAASGILLVAMRGGTQMRPRAGCQDARIKGSGWIEPFLSDMATTLPFQGVIHA